MGYMKEIVLGKGVRRNRYGTLIQSGIKIIVLCRHKKLTEIKGAQTKLDINLVPHILILKQLWRYICYNKYVILHYMANFVIDFGRHIYIYFLTRCISRFFRDY
ncbi:hypothetical protein ACJX0J_025515 [Zea mays]